MVANCMAEPKPARTARTTSRPANANSKTTHHNKFRNEYESPEDAPPLHSMASSGRGALSVDKVCALNANVSIVNATAVHATLITVVVRLTVVSMVPSIDLTEPITNEFG